MGRICSWHAAFSHLFLIFVSLYCHRVERNTPGGVSGDCFFYLLAVLLLSPAAGLPCCSQDQAFPAPSSLSFPSFFFFFKLLGERHAAGASQADISMGYAEHVCVNPVSSDPSSPFLYCSKLRCHLDTMAKWKPWIAGATVSCLQ